MKVEKPTSPIVCDTLGCGNIATVTLKFATGHTINVCPECYAELESAFEKEKPCEKRSDKNR